MNMATALVLIVVALIIIGAMYGSYRMIKTGDTCAGCPNRGTCRCHEKNPIHCTVKKDCYPAGLETPPANNLSLLKD